MSRNVVVKESGIQGKGVFALRNFHKGDVVFRNKRSRIVKTRDLKRLSKDDRIHLNEIDWDTWEVMNSPGRYVNHSCVPNAVPKESARKRVPYMALRAIKKGEEITDDYRINAHDGGRWRCHCGSKSCSGTVISDFFSLDEVLQKKYLFYAPTFIQEKYKKRHGK